MVYFKDGQQKEQPLTIDLLIIQFSQVKNANDSQSSA